jgi:hypothetical protein
MEPNSLFQDSTGISGSSAVYSVTQRSVLNSSNLGAVNSGNGPSQLSVGDAQSHEQVSKLTLFLWTKTIKKYYLTSPRHHADFFQYWKAWGDGGGGLHNFTTKF